MNMDNTKERIVKAAMELFKEDGFHQVSIRKIIEKAELSNGGFYHHFKSKDELLFYINDFIMQYVIDTSKKAICSNMTPTEKMYEVTRAFVNAFDVYNLGAVVMYQESHYLAPEYYQKMKEKRDIFKVFFMDTMEEGMRLGEFRSNMSLLVSSMSIFGLVNWTHKWYNPDKELTIDEITKYYVDFIFNAILTDKAKNNPKYAKYMLEPQDKVKF